VFENFKSLFESVVLIERYARTFLRGLSSTKRCTLLPSNSGKKYGEIPRSTLLVYLYLVRKRRGCGVREIQRALGFSSSSSAYYHLEKLVHEDILTRDSYGNYKVKYGTRVELMNRFIVIHGVMLPKPLIYATVTTTMCLFCVSLFWNTIALTIILALLPGVVASGIFWYDAVKTWSSLPSFKNDRSTTTKNRSNV
jgi:hypothetical protein